MLFLKESIIYFCVRAFGALVRFLPLSAALWIGRIIGLWAYYFDVRHRSLAYANLKKAFAESKSSNELKRITKQLFQNYGQNFIDLFRLPLLTPEKFNELVTVEGKENIHEALKKGKGAILLAMHFGSWELASLSCAMMSIPYKVIVNPQSKYSKLDELLNSYRSCGGSVVLSRGLGTRDLIKSLQNNEVIGMVVDQGGKDGALIPFFNRQASMSVGAMRIAFKYDVPLLFSIIIREKNGHHRLIIQKPFELTQTADVERDVETNLNVVVQTMERYIVKYPSEYMWFYKIWKYSKQSNITILSDGKMGHLRQSQRLAELLKKALSEREIQSNCQVINIKFKNDLLGKFFSVISLFSHPFFMQGRLAWLRLFLKKESFEELMNIKTDFIVSCGSATAGINYLLAKDHNAKSICLQRPGMLNIDRFDLAVLPIHDMRKIKKDDRHIAVTNGALNMISDGYLKEQSQLLLNRFSHLKTHSKAKIGLLIGGDSKNIYLSDHQIKILIHQLQGVLKEINADVLLTTSRRTPEEIEQMIAREFKKEGSCPLFINPKKDDVPEAVGGILGLSDIVIVSGDSISMISEAASSGKSTIVFYPQLRKGNRESNKHIFFIENLNAQGYVSAVEVRDIGQRVFDVAKGKIKTKRLDDAQNIYETVKKVI